MGTPRTSRHPGWVTAASAGLVSCGSCHKLLRIDPQHRAAGSAHCPRCGAQLRSRRRASLQSTLALIIAAAILYIPANLLPVMSVVMLGQGEPDTILSGVKQLIASGMWPLALIVFVASIFVPILKIVTLSFLLWTTGRRSHWRPLDRTRLYRVTEFVGRWSMVDIYVIAILTALVQFGNLATIVPGPGSLSFAAVVVLTMFAANSFDQRLIWDPLDSTQ